MGKEDSAHRDSQSLWRSLVQKCWDERYKSCSKPAARDEPRQPDARAIHGASRFGITRERSVFGLMPLACRLLSKTRPMADHGFEQLVSQCQSLARPCPACRQVTCSENYH